MEIVPMNNILYHEIPIYNHSFPSCHVVSCIMAWSTCYAATFCHYVCSLRELETKSQAHAEMSPNILRLEVGQALSVNLQAIAVMTVEMISAIRPVACDDANCDGIDLICMD